MIRRLRKKFIWIAMLSLLGTMLLLCAGISFGNYIFTTSGADMIIQMLHENDGQFPTPEIRPSPTERSQFQVTLETPFETRYYVAKATAEGTVEQINEEHIAALDQKEIAQQVKTILQTGKQYGYLDYYRYHCYSESDGSFTVIVLDCFADIHDIYNGFYRMALIFLLCICIVFALLLFFSKRAIRPFVENQERQQRFVTDASHELKTPLAILSANLGLLESLHGKSPWFDSSKAQIKRMDGLIGELVELARAEEEPREMVFAEFSLSELAENVIQTFEPLALEKGIQLTTHLEPNLRMRGVVDDVFRLLTILLDNGVKYCEKGGELKVDLYRKGWHLGLNVSNPCTDLKPEQVSRLFDRFYRADTSRSRQSGGYGIGLSTAKAIVTRHHGRIQAQVRNGNLVFTVWLPVGQLKSK